MESQNDIALTPSQNGILQPTSLPQPPGEWEPMAYTAGRALVRLALTTMRTRNIGRVYHLGLCVEAWVGRAGVAKPGVAAYWYERVVLLGTSEGECWAYRADQAWEEALTALAALSTSGTPIETPGNENGNLGHSDAQESPLSLGEGAPAWTGGMQPGTVVEATRDGVRKTGRLGFNGD